MQFHYYYAKTKSGRIGRLRNQTKKEVEQKKNKEKRWVLIFETINAQKI